MSYYDSSAWQAPLSAPAWEPRAVASPVPLEETGAFTSQIDEVERALDNLVKSGKFFPARRDGMPLLSPGIPHAPATPIDPRMAQPVARPAFLPMNSDPEILRSQSSMGALNGYYASQRFQPSPAAVPPTPQPRVAEPEQVLQIKRRLAAARERDLRNYHQEQQFNRSMSPDTTRKVFQPLNSTGLLSDVPPFAPAVGKERVLSPSGLSDDERRDVANRQRGGLYNMSDLADEQNFLRTSGADQRVISPRLAFDPFQSQQQQQQHQRSSGSASPVDRSRTNSNGTSSPSSRSANFSLFDSATTQQSNTSSSSPEHSPPRVPLVRANTTSAVAPIGTRPIGPSSAGPIGRPQVGSPFGLNSEVDSFVHHLPERTSSAASNPSVASATDGSFPSSNLGNNNNNSSTSSTPTSSSANAIAWSSKVWGNKGLGMAASVWG